MSISQGPVDQAPASHNVARFVTSMAEAHPHQRAVVVPVGRDSAGRVTWSHLTFAQLDAASGRYAEGLRRVGIDRGVKTVLMVPPSLDFFALVFGLFKVGAVIVLIDPGLGRKAVLDCLREVEAEAFVGVPTAQLARLLFPGSFRSVRTTVTVGRRWFWGGHDLAALAALGAGSPAPAFTAAAEEPAAILFTSGSTGVPKGALYTHGIFDAQVRLLRDLYQIEPGEIDLPTFPLFALFAPALGQTAVIPDMDARLPARADPARLIEAIEDHGCTQMFGSPALLDNLGRYASERGIRLSSLRRVLSAGAPMRPAILQTMDRILPPEAQVYTPYGATESLPVSSIGHREVLGETAARTAEGWGVCVGRVVPEMCVRIITVTDEPIPTWSADLELPRGRIGEITVRGPVVTTTYVARPRETALSKIREGDTTVHRMGDLGWLDDRDRLWMCGRKSQRVVTSEGDLFTVVCEGILNTCPGVFRTALVGVGARPAQEPVLCVELEAGVQDPDEVLARVRERARSSEATRSIRHFLHHPGGFPVDIRHNAKIGREKLAVWAAGRLRAGAGGEA